MTFLSGWRLLLLLVPLLLLVAYLVMLRSRRQAAVRFSSAELLRTVAPKRSGWQRFVPWASLLTAIVVGVLAFAQPAWAMRTPKERATIMLTLDVSASMLATDVDPSRLQAAQQAARDFVAALPAGLQVGLVTFDQSARLLVSPGTDRTTLLAAIDAMRVGQGTATGSGIDLALSTLEGVPPGDDGTKAPAAIVLMSDGAPTVGSGRQSATDTLDEATARAASDGVPVTTIAFGTPDGSVTIRGEQVAVPYDPQTMAGIAEATGGQTFTAESADQLGSVYEQIGSIVGYDVESYDLTALAAGLALLFASLAAASAIGWATRLA
ncbi:MAG: VWA domain-containing protein [Actinomycetota bacterium]|nr:MAG: VWA domain-containing protein [Actinomycetota bacterium]